MADSSALLARFLHMLDVSEVPVHGCLLMLTGEAHLNLVGAWSSCSPARCPNSCLANEYQEFMALSSEVGALAASTTESY